MNKADILISQNHGTYKINVKGRATFESSPPIRNLAKNIKNENIHKISVNLMDCGGMDSTFMGVLTMLGLEARKINAPMEIISASDANYNLLDSLGLTKLFVFADESSLAAANDDWEKLSSETTLKQTAETVHDAHEALIDAEKKNKPEFEKVVDLTKKELDRMNVREEANKD